MYDLVNIVIDREREMEDEDDDELMILRRRFENREDVKWERVETDVCHVEILEFALIDSLDSIFSDDHSFSFALVNVLLNDGFFALVAFIAHILYLSCLLACSTGSRC
jgi:hypothetical protein